MDSRESEIFIIDLLSAERHRQIGMAIGSYCSEKDILLGTRTLLPHLSNPPVEGSLWKASVTYAQRPTSTISDAEDTASVSSGTVFSADDISPQLNYSSDEFYNGSVNVLLKSSYEGYQEGMIEPCVASTYLKSDIIVEVPRATLQPSTNFQRRDACQVTSDSVSFNAVVDTCKDNRSPRPERVGSQTVDAFATRLAQTESDKTVAESTKSAFFSRIKWDLHKVNGTYTAHDPRCKSPPSSRQSESTSAESLTVHTRDNQRNGEENRDEGDEEDDRNNRGPSRVENPIAKRHITRKLACPFYKRDPSKYMEIRPCAGPGWKNISSLKEHLYLKHRSFKCVRCSEAFVDNAQLVEHQRKEVPCPINNETSHDSISAEIELQLRKSEKTPQRWREIYHIIFPEVHEVDIPSPYYEYGECVRTPIKELPQPESPRPILQREVQGMLMSFGENLFDLSTTTTSKLLHEIGGQGTSINLQCTSSDAKPTELDPQCQLAPDFSGGHDRGSIRDTNYGAYSKSSDFSDIEDCEPILSVDPAKNGKKSTILVRFLRWHRKCVYSRLDLLAYQAEQVRSATTGSSSGGTGIGRGQSGQQSQGKRKYSHKDGGGQSGDDINEEDDTDRPNPKRRKLLGNDKPEILLELFACPYFQHDPETYIRWRSCPGPGWSTVHRVKEHIYRRHRLPKYRCFRCWQDFKDRGSLKTHCRSSIVCGVISEPISEGLDEELEEKLKSRKGKSPDHSEPDKWVDMYKTLFPDHHIPSPYYNTRTPELYVNLRSNSQAESLLDFGEYVQREIPPLTEQLRNDRDCDPLNSGQNGTNASEVAVVQRAYEMVVQEYFQSDNISGDSCAGRLNPPASEGIDPLFQFDTDRFFQDVSSANLELDFFTSYNIDDVGSMLDVVADSGYDTLEQSSGSGDSGKNRVENV